ncbi:hypothetical protein J437_LFUL016283, partial [Ladona fulva]
MIPHKVCKECVESFQKGSHDKLPFGLPDLKPDDHNILHGPFFERRNYIFPFMSIKLGYCLKYLIFAFPNLPFENIKKGFLSFKNLAKEISEITHAQVYTKIAHKLEELQIIACKLSIKEHFLYSHLADFPKTLKGEQMNQDLKVNQACYQTRWEVRIVDDNCSYN